MHSSLPIRPRRDRRVPESFVLLAAFTLMLAVSIATAQSAPSQSATPPTGEMHEPAYVQFGFETRVRTEDWNNVLDLSDSNDDERRQMRFRTRSWLSLTSKAVDLNVGLVNEFYTKFALKPADHEAYRFNMDEVVFDNLNLTLKKLPVRGLSVTVGRQSLQRGEGFSLFDGTAGDGSRTAYFNAVNLSYQRNHTMYEILGILNPKVDRFLSIIHDQHKRLQDWDEQAVGLYYTNREHNRLDIDSYYFYKKEINDWRSPADVQFQPNRHLHTVGTRVVKRLDHGYSLTGEFAGQWGRQHANPVQNDPAADIRAWGGYLYAKKAFPVSWKPYIVSGYWAMSGDDPSNTKTLTGFDPIFSRWPKLSELVIYSLVAERGVAYWSNLHALQFQAGISPTKALNLRASFFEQQAFHPWTKNPTTFGSGTHRGENYQLRADYTFNDRWKCHVLYENFVPGDYFRHTDDSFFVQAQVVYQFTSKFHLRRH